MEELFSARVPKSSAEVRRVSLPGRLSFCGGELAVLGTRLLSGSARGCSPRHQGRGKVKGSRKCRKLKVMKRGESEVDGEVGESHSTCA